jgi:Na+-driven multidrug efflux pump
LVRIVSVFGSVALAGYTIGIRIIAFVIMPSWGLSGAAATLVGQNLGAKQPEQAEESAWKTGVYNMFFLGGVGVFLIIFPGPVVHLFTHDPAIVTLGVSCLRILSLGNVGYAYGMVMLQAFNGAGDTVTPTVVNFFGFWLVEIPLAYALAILTGLRSEGVYLAIFISESAIAAASVVLFRRGRWKSKRI